MKLEKNASQWASFEYEIKPKDNFSFGLLEVWQRRELLYFYTWRGVRVRYKQAVLGISWAVIQPLFFVGIFTLIFSRGIKIETNDLAYPVFAFTGMVVWQYFNTGVLHAATGLYANAHIIRKIYFPRLVIPIAAVGVAAFDFIFAFLVLFMISLCYGGPANWGRFLFFTPLSIFMCSLATVGMGILLASFHVRFKDFQYLIPFMLQAMLFISPIIYPTEALGVGGWVGLLDFNPITAPIYLMRAGFSDGDINWMAIAKSSFSILTICVLGLYFFKKLEAYFADLI